MVVFGRKGKPKKRVVFVEIGGFIPRVRGFQEILSRRPTFSDILFFLWDMGHKSDGVFIEITPSNLSISEMWEIRRVVEILQKKRKKVVSFLKGGGIPEFFLADSCDRTFLQEGANYFLMGLSVHLNTFGRFFRKIHVELEAIKSGELKSIPDMLTKERMPDEVRKDIKRFLREIKHILIKSTKRFPSDIYFSGILSGKELVIMGVGDGVFSDTSFDLLKKEFGDVELIRLQKKFSPLRIKRGRKVAFVNMHGIVGSNPSPNVISPAAFSGVLSRLAENSDVESVVIRLNSRGGDAEASEILNENIKLLSRKKRTFISFSNVGASGGYLIASPASKIFATPFSAIGSIGVFLIKPYVAKLLDRIGVKTEIIKEGEMSTIFSPFKKLSQKERKVLENFVKEEHLNFMKKVSEGRGIPFAEIKKIADGSVFSGKRAKELGLVDELKSLPEVLEEAKDGKKLEIDEYPKINLYDILFPKFGGSRILLPKYPELQSLLDVIPLKSSHSSPLTLLYMFPFDLVVR